MRASTIRLVTLVALAVAVALPVATGAPRANAQAPQTGELFYAHPQGVKGPLVAFGMGGGKARFTLPPGMAAADRQHYYATTITGSRTQLDAFDLTTGQVRRSFPFDGRWSLSGVSPTGRWIALTRVPSELERQEWTTSGLWQTAVRIVDTEDGTIAHALDLDGNFEVETISLFGDSLFLIQHLPAVNPDHYLIRLYDLAVDTLVEGALRDKTATDEVMAGYAWEGLASPDGQWLLTLYLSTRRNVAFVHTLDLTNKYPVCIDLPSGTGDMAQLKQYALALSPDGRRLYATNASLGMVAEIDLQSREISRVDAFMPGSVRPPGSGAQGSTARSVVSADDRTVYFTSGTDVWTYDVASGSVTGSFPVAGPITGLGLSHDGGRLFIASPRGRGTVTALDTASGRALALAGGNGTT